MQIKVYLRVARLAADGVEFAEVKTIAKFDANKYRAQMSTNGVLKIFKGHCPDLHAAYSQDSWSFMVTE
ncbi:hypothetical protein vBAmePR8F_gp16 [Alteromonas phage vB_AmeP_R8W]|uniref:Uncharacterized protein n=1 Tax=Alteromonas phage vB_AmeP_R8W TaxID=2774152 RepID=A0A8E4W5U9_9CAUD|nr:hypothetical protein vBAmePR8F_gp16 [Alteromonas phage vB_AmeP_R8W]